MAASAKALSCPSGSEARSLRKSARNQTQSNRIGDGPGIEGMIEGEIGEGSAKWPREGGAIGLAKDDEF